MAQFRNDFNDMVEIMFIFALLECTLSLIPQVNSGNKEEKKKDSEKEREMSQNAQFRAIQPSPSILTFVEKNVICMKTFDCHMLYVNTSFP